jgi:DNA-binding HxlR family transcriptional regulator
MKEYGQFCPVAKTAEVFAERWTPLIIRELCCGAAHFNDLRSRLPRLSKTLLVQRLKELESAGIVAITPKEKGRGNSYRLTQSGEEFREIITLMSRWGQRWAQDTISRDDLDPTFLMFSLRGQINRDLLPRKQLVLRIEFWGVPQQHSHARRWWLVFQPEDIDLCLKDPGHAVDVSLRADLALFSRVWLGYLGMTEAVSTHAMSFEGTSDKVQRIKTLLDLRDRPYERPLAYAAPPAPAAE